MRFPPEFIQRLRDAIPISEVIGRRVTLRRHGREFQACCPFHKEKSPSFTVNDEKGFYHCFGCAAHGDAIGFIKEFEGCAYPEAVERLAQEAGMALPKMTREAEAQEKRRATLQDVVAQAAQWFAEQLQTQAGKEGLDYLSARGLGRPMIERFSLGYAPAGREALKSFLLKKNIPAPMLAEAGLVAAREDGSTYDRFRGRLIFPIRNLQGHIVAFGGRILPAHQTEHTAKYLNSPETPLFHKGEMLFAADLARKAARETGTVIVAEGYMDVIALHEAGFAHAVAPLGTAITEQQLKLLWRMTKQPILCLDGDAAGKRAMLRAAELALPLLQPDTGLRFARLPAGQDPDSLIRARGRDAMQDILAQAQVLSEAIWEDALSRYGAETAEQKAELEHYLNQQAARVGDKGLGGHMKQFFRDSIYQISRQARKMRPFSAPKEQPLQVSLPPQDDASQLKIIENQIIISLLLCPPLLLEPECEERVAHMDFTQPVLDKLRCAALELGAETQTIDSERLHARFAARGLSGKVEELLHSGTNVLTVSDRSQLQAGGAAAQRVFERMCFAHTLKRTEQDMHDAARQLETDMTEANFARLVALQKQMEDLRRSPYHVMHDEHVS